MMVSTIYLRLTEFPQHLREKPALPEDVLPCSFNIFHIPELGVTIAIQFLVGPPGIHLLDKVQVKALEFTSDKPEQMCKWDWIAFHKVFALLHHSKPRAKLY